MSRASERAALEAAEAAEAYAEGLRKAKERTSALKWAAGRHPDQVAERKRKEEEERDLEERARRAGLISDLGSMRSSISKSRYA